MIRAGIISFCCMAAAFASDMRQYSVCEVLNRSSEINGRVVQVVGLIQGSPFHGYLMSQSQRDDPCPGGRERFLTAPSSLLLIWRSSYGVTLTANEERGNQLLLEELRRRYMNRQVLPSQVEVTGTVVSKAFPVILRRSDGVYQGNGFGDFGGYPVLVVVKRATIVSRDPGVDSR